MSFWDCVSAKAPTAVGKKNSSWTTQHQEFGESQPEEGQALAEEEFEKCLYCDRGNYLF